MTKYASYVSALRKKYCRTKQTKYFGDDWINIYCCWSIQTQSRLYNTYKTCIHLTWTIKSDSSTLRRPTKHWFFVGISEVVERMLHTVAHGVGTYFIPSQFAITNHQRWVSRAICGNTWMAITSFPALAVHAARQKLDINISYGNHICSTKLLLRFHSPISLQWSRFELEAAETRTQIKYVSHFTLLFIVTDSISINLF